MHLFALPAVLCALSYCAALPSSVEPQPLPLVIWHGLGDRYDADGLHSVGELAQEVYPGTYVYYIRIDDDGGEDRSATFLGNLTEQVASVCQALHDDPKLKDKKTGEVRVDALGFSQGGQFLRGLLQRCNGLSMRSLVTFGSQHNGIAQIKACGTWDFVCKGALALIRGNAWTDYAQSHVVPAQYYRTINDTTGLASDDYLKHSNFLADINNERDVRNATYNTRLASLETMVMFVFENDTTVIPKESGWFAEVNATSGEVTPLRNRKMYKEDWVGLKKLDKKGGLIFKTTPGDHMQLEEDILKDTFAAYFGPEQKTDMAATWWRFWQQKPDDVNLATFKDVL
ncbi:related to palmitoyl-(protein) hydrolase [Ramularia collo-cygni]|uniref:Palmitoyl-protein thioesterase 1 n=1 Tax=Ramularia collo-cygni TaxID=112498 RepID=A0A2D3VDW4_9PEZI|nr:related to palmitoyl-(protein) hydrolase [Ramularia collo-cygni]CZT18783.1 related to palmitoyl-(protein) hydrolase [Ramularia collo-cygni]